MNHRRVLLICVRLLGFAAIAQAVAAWIFLRSMSMPIERHYLSAYFWSSLPLISPSTIEVRLIWKTGRHRKQALATDSDVDSVDGTGMALSQSARDSGWKALIEGPPQQIPSDLLSQDLASLAFQGQSLWDLLVLPELSALAALVAASGSWYLLIGFFRALPSEIAWRRRLFNLQESSARFFEERAALTRTAHSWFKTLHRSAVQRMEMQDAAPRTTVAVMAPVPKPACFALPLFGVYNGNGRGYLWNEKDAIE
ncbi:hypothetical protein P8935_14370 [Telmatobacter sp. DSM 110680]|uniref:Uncharacterized protein n=1 Tax=Telmatobacter sp. DSM 110680 TaxID=3036704 RepID=A0AAU7DEI4_9BACT